MGIEQDIKQISFRSTRHKLALNLIYTSNWLNGKLAVHFKDTGITAQQYNVLRILRGQQPNACNLKLIKERMLDRMSDASRIVDKLVEKGLMERKICRDDRRQVDLFINKKGLDLLKKLDFVDEATVKIFTELSDKEVEQLNHLLDHLRSSDKNEKD